MYIFFFKASPYIEITKNNTLKQISKSNFLSGTQCHKKLYFDKFRKDLIPAEDDAQEALFELGHEIGALAKKYFVGGLDASPENFNDFSGSISNTLKWIKEKTPTIYEAAFSSNGVFAALDILHHLKGKRWAIEVKSSTDVKDYHLTDASLQFWVMDKCGFKPDKFYIMHINNEYVRSGEIDVRQLFTLADITKEVIANQSWVNAQVEELHLVLNKGNEPKIGIGKHCNDPFSCQFQNHCWKHIPEEYSVFELYSARGKDWQLYDLGVLHLKNVDENTFKLNHRQKLQIAGAKKGESYIDKVSISNFLKDWQYPLYFFDFETIFPAIPVLDGTRPFQQVPFQFSLHIIERPQGEVIHHEFLADPRHFNEGTDKNPREELIKALKAYIGKIGSIVAYNATFEVNVLRDLAVAFPDHKKFIDSLISRFVDLLIPFRSAWYYLPSMGGSASIKSVLPAIAPEFGYEDLEIGNGSDASNIFLSMIKKAFEGNEEETRNALKKYCERDTFGMVILYQKLRELAP